jgi:NADPH-dependent glutamate synthase beta subunit-like oxidoreductase
MRRHLRSFSSPSVWISLAALVLASGGLAVAAIPSASNDTVRACYKKKNGQLRIVKRGKCKKSETAISWNKEGPQGLTGKPGVAGAQGTQGATGSAGSALAYAHVNADGSLDASRSKNIASVTKPGGFIGIYCVDVASGTPQNAVVTGEATPSGGAAQTYGVVRVHPESEGTVCAEPNRDAFVRMHDDTGAQQNTAFFIVFN